jgi:hypothetical protein
MQCNVTYAKENLSCFKKLNTISEKISENVGYLLAETKHGIYFQFFCDIEVTFVYLRKEI